MRIDHVSYAARSGGLRETAEQLADILGIELQNGGVHPRFGTRNMILPLGNGQYVEVVEVLDHPASIKAPFGQAVRQRANQGGGWLGWVVEIDDITHFERRLGRPSAPGNRYRPDGTELRWRQIGISGMIADPQLPFIVQWEVPRQLHPSAPGRNTTQLAGLRLAGDQQRISQWLSGSNDWPQFSATFEFEPDAGAPGLRCCSFITPLGLVTV